MKNLILGIGAIVLIAILAVGGLAMTKPATIEFERSVTLEATPADVAPFAEDLRKVVAWSPWTDKDPDLVQSWSDETTGVGAWYAWEGNDEVGSGKQTIASVEPGKVVHDLHFTAPFDDQAQSSLTWTEEGDNVVFTWAFHKDSSGFGTKVAQVFMDLEAMIAPDYEKGLERLQAQVQEAVAAREAAEAEAEAAAQAEAEAEDADTTVE